MKNKKPRRARTSTLAAIVLAATLCSSCFTAAVWSPEVRGSQYGLHERICLTPFAMALDILTWPLQRLIFEPRYNRYHHNSYDSYDCD